MNLSTNMPDLVTMRKRWVYDPEAKAKGQWDQVVSSSSVSLVSLDGTQEELGALIDAINEARLWLGAAEAGCGLNETQTIVDTSLFIEMSKGIVSASIEIEEEPSDAS